MINNQLYHIHRYGNMDELWQVGNQIKIDNNFNSLFFIKLQEEELLLTNRYRNYDLDLIIAGMESMRFNNLAKNDLEEYFDILLCSYYFLRREKALEEGRKIFNPSAPSRQHSIFLTDKNNYTYWVNKVGNSSYQTFLLELNGNIFVSSDKYFPNHTLSLYNQVEESKKYWNPKSLKMTSHKEYIFQGDAKIIK